MPSYRYRGIDRASNRTVAHTENADGKRPRRGQGEGNIEQHDNSRRKQLYGFKRQVSTHLQCKCLRVTYGLVNVNLLLRLGL